MIGYYLTTHAFDKIYLNHFVQIYFIKDNKDDDVVVVVFIQSAALLP